MNDFSELGTYEILFIIIGSTVALCLILICICVCKNQKSEDEVTIISNKSVAGPGTMVPVISKG